MKIVTLLIALIGFALIGNAVSPTPPEAADVAAEFAPLTDAELELAAPAWQRNCAKCHGDDGNGPASKMGARLGLKINYAEPGALDGFTDEELSNITSEGVPDTKMRGYSSKLSVEEVSALTRYMRSMAHP